MHFAGNNWGSCDDGTSGMGCGPQETFRSCADIRIEPHPLLFKVFFKATFEGIFNLNFWYLEYNTVQ